MRISQRKLTCLLLLLLTAALVTLWRFRLDKDTGAGSGNNAAPGPPVAATERSGLPAAAKTGEKSLPGWGTPEFNKMMLERCAKWLESRGRDGAGLVALWDLAGNEALLLEAAERFPDDPRVCAAMIAYLDHRKGDTLPWAERMIAAEPDNPAAHYLKAEALAKAGRTEEALEALRTAVGRGGKPEPHLRERILTAREAVLAGGGSVKEAAFAALAAPMARMGTPVFAGGAIKALREGIREARAAGDAERAVEVAALGAAAAEHQRYAGARTIVNDLVSNSILRVMLGELPADTEYGGEGKTAGERLAEIEAEKTAMLKLLREGDVSGDIMAPLTDSQASEYTDRFILHGEEAARRWLNGILSKSGLPGQGGDK